MLQKENATEDTYMFPRRQNTFTFSHLADAFIQSDLQLRNT